MRVLVTGAGGFLGTAICRRLVEQGDTVRGLARSDYPHLRQIGVELVRGDIREPEDVQRACQGVEVVHHTAAIAGIWGKWETYYRTNVAGTENVLEACRRAGVSRLVYTSSPSVTFAGSDQVSVDEREPYPSHWLCHYSRTKALAEQAVLGANGRDGLWTCSLRPHLIWGPGDPHLIPRLIARARAGRLRRVGDGGNQISITYVDNAALAHVLAAEALEGGRVAAGKPYFINQFEPVACWDWIDQILGMVGLPPVRRSVSFRKAWWAGAVCEWVYGVLRIEREPPMTRFLAAQLAKSHSFSVARAEADFGYHEEVSTEEGMRRLANWLATR